MTLSPTELRQAWMDARAGYIDNPWFRDGSRMLCPWNDVWEVVVWLEGGRVLAAQGNDGKPIVAEEGESLALALSKPAERPGNAHQADADAGPEGCH